MSANVCALLWQHRGRRTRGSPPQLGPRLCLHPGLGVSMLWTRGWTMTGSSSHKGGGASQGCSGLLLSYHTEKNDLIPSHRGAGLCVCVCRHEGLQFVFIPREYFVSHQCGCKCVSSYPTSGGSACRSIGRDRAVCQNGSADVWRGWRNA